MENNATPVTPKLDAPCKVLNHRQINGLLPHIYVQHSSSSDQHDLLLERQDRMAQDFKTSTANTI